MKNEKISVVLIVYNGQKTLMPCIKSILNQTYRNFELIIVDNNSTDKTKEIIENFQERDKRVKYVFEPKRGRGAARNAGIRKAKGSIIATTDADCIVPENWLEQITEPIRKEGENAVLGFEQSLNNGYWSRNIQLANWDYVSKIVNSGYINHMDPKNFAIKSDLVRKIKFNEDVVTMEDFEFYLRLRKFSRIRFLPGLRVMHHDKDSFSKFVRMQSDRAYWTAILVKRYGKNFNSRKEPMTRNAYLNSLKRFPYWFKQKFLENTTGYGFFCLISEITWKLGLTAGYIWGK